MVIFTDKETEPVIRKMREPHLNNTRIIIIVKFENMLEYNVLKI